MRDNSFLLLVLIVFITIMVIGGHFGIGMSGSIEAPEMENESPGITGLISYAWAGIQVFFAIMFFQVPGMPVVVSWIFIIITVMCGWIIAKWARGTTTGA